MSLPNTANVARVQYLSDEWIQRADAALAEAWAAADRPGGAAERGAATGDGDTTTTVAYEVAGAPGGKVAYHLHFGPDGAGVGAGPPQGEPTATMALDYDTAVEIARGEESAQAAFMQGRLKLDGDVTVLINRAPELAAVGDALAGVRADTTY